MVKTGQDNLVYYTAETSEGVSKYGFQSGVSSTPPNATWSPLLEVQSISGRGKKQEKKKIYRLGRRIRSGVAEGKIMPDDLVFELFMVDSTASLNFYDTFIKGSEVFDTAYDETSLQSYTFFIPDDTTPASSQDFEYYYGCVLKEVEIGIDEGDPNIVLTATFDVQWFVFNDVELYATDNFSIDCSQPTSDVTFADDNPDTITRESGSWITDGILVGNTVTITGSGSNNTVYTVASVSALVITLIGGDAITPETNTTDTITFTQTGIVYTAHPTGLTYLLWSDVTITKDNFNEAGGSSVGVKSIQNISLTITQEYDKIWCIDGVKYATKNVVKGYTCSGSFSLLYENLTTIWDEYNETGQDGDLTIVIDRDGATDCNIVLDKVILDNLSVDSSPNELQIVDADYDAEQCVMT